MNFNCEKTSWFLISGDSYEYLIIRQLMKINGQLRRNYRIEIEKRRCII